jgi:hypothetical protein
MISGKRLTLLCLLAMPPAVASAAPDPADPALTVLLAQLARPAPASTAFVEVRWSKLLTTPLVSAGTLEYRGAGALSRQVERPYRERTEIAGDDVRVERAGRAPRRFTLERAPELKALLGSFAALIAGDASALARDFTLALADAAPSWRLRLTPRDARLRRRLAAIEVDGRATMPRCFWIAGRDSSGVMLVEDAAREPLPEPLERAALERHCRTAP